jgi:inner membrane protein
MRIHPAQYLLVGAALCVFYLLLISLSEHIKFNPAYWVSTAATVILITAYSSTIFRSKKLTISICITLLALYGFLYSLLQLQDYALLMGSLGLFSILAAIMYLSRNIDWYNLGNTKK